MTGGLGFIGSSLAHHLVDLGADVLLVDGMMPDYGGNLLNLADIEDRVHHAEFGANSRLDEIQAAVLSARLKWLPRWTDARRALARRYSAALASASVNVPAEQDPGHVHHLFPVFSESRASLQSHLKARGIETLIHHPIPIPRQAAVALEHPAECPVADRISADVFSLPLHPGMTPQAVEEITSALQAFHAAA